uniref:Uncharacterized protein n=1 Tax=Arundo donax TaxID=35708 RepID=A0A0A9HNC6_ARUDO
MQRKQWSKSLLYTMHILLYQSSIRAFDENNFNR